ncbi:MAG: DinB family protein [Bacteroidota bacterium]
MTNKLILLAVAALLLFSSSKMKAQDTPPAALPGFRGDLIKDINDVENKIHDLADAIPQEKYGWRPGDGVRSISEVYIHIADANFMFPTFFGAKKQEGLEKDMEKTVTDKGKVLAVVKQSFIYLREAITNLTDADLDKPAKMFGEETTVRGVLLTTATHMHEHLGQSIAYARMNQIVPPWTAAEQAAAKAKKAKKEGGGN